MCDCILVFLNSVVGDTPTVVFPSELLGFPRKNLVLSVVLLPFSVCFIMVSETGSMDSMVIFSYFSCLAYFVVRFSALQSVALLSALLLSRCCEVVAVTVASPFAVVATACCRSF